MSKSNTNPFAEEDDGKRSAGLNEYFTSVNPPMSAPPPVPNFLPPDEVKPPLTPPQQERVALIQSSRQQQARPQKSIEGKDARLSTLLFTPAEMEKIRQATIAAFKADLLYKNDKNTTKEFRNPNQGLTDIINVLDDILKKNNKYPGGLEDAAKEALVTSIQKEYQVQQKNYEQTTISGIGKSKKEQAITAAHIVKRTMAIIFSAIGAVLGKPMHALGGYLVEKGEAIEKDAVANIAKLDETKYEVYDSTKVDKLQKREEFGERVRDIGANIIGGRSGVLFEKSLDIIDSIRKKNYAASETVTHVINAVKKSNGKGGVGK